MEAAQLKCITEHDGFVPVCLHEEVLEVAWLQYKQQYGRKASEGPHHKKMRHTAYRQFVRWVWRFLGRDIRVSLPSCVYKSIRTKFPLPASQRFTGFKYGDEHQEDDGSNDEETL